MKDIFKKTPKCVVQRREHLYMVHRIIVILLQCISSVRACVSRVNMCAYFKD